MGSFQNLLYGKLLANVSGEHIRTYYYDAIIDESTIDECEKEEKEEFRKKRGKQKAFFCTINDNLSFCDIRLGHLVHSKRKGLRQKGVDIKMAIDMLTKAYDNHYEFAILVAGDGDFVYLVDAVKDAGRRVIGAYYEDNVSPDLKESFDQRIILTKADLKPV